MSLFQLRALGSPSLKGAEGGEIVQLLRQPKRVALLAYLAIAHPGAFARRDRLLALFWPEFDDTHARDALNSSLLFLRRHLGADVVLSRGGDVGLAPGSVWTDVAALEEAAASGRHAEALALYRGPLCDGFHVDGPGFEEWMEAERARLRDLAGETARQAVEAAIAAGETALALSALRRWMGIVPGDERAVTRLVQVLHAIGDPAGALREHQAHVARLAEDYGLEPTGDLLAVAEGIRNGQPPLFRLGTPPPMPSARPAPSLPPAAEFREGSVATEPVKGSAGEVGRRRWGAGRSIAGSAAIALVIIVLAVVSWPTLRLLGQPDIDELTFAGIVRQPVLSPDNQLLAYIRQDCDSLGACHDGLVVRDTSGSGARVVATAADGMSFPFWTADRRYLVFTWAGREHDEAVVVPATGGEPRVLGCCFAGRSASGDTVLLSDGHTTPPVLRFVTVADGIAHDSLRVPPGVAFVQPLAHGRFVLLGRHVVDRRGRLLDSLPAPVSAQCGRRNSQWSPGGDAVYYGDCDLDAPGVFHVLRLPIGADGRFRPPADTVVRNLQLGLINPFFRVSDDERQLTYTVNRPNAAVALRRTSAGVMRFTAKVLATFGSRIHGRLDPSGRRVAIGRLVNPARSRWEFSVMPFDSGPEHPVGAVDGVTVTGWDWSGDGSALMLAQRRPGDSVDVVRLDVATGARTLLSSVAYQNGSLLGVPGGGVLLHVRTRGHDGFLRVGMPGLADSILPFSYIPAGSTGPGGSAFSSRTAAVSPDGKALVSFAEADDSVVLERMSLRTGARQRLASWPRFGVRAPVWLPDGTLQIGQPWAWYALMPGEKKPRLLGRLPYPVANYQFTADGLRAIANVASTGGDAYLIRNLDALIRR